MFLLTSVFSVPNTVAITSKALSECLLNGWWTVVGEVAYGAVEACGRRS